MADIRIKDLPTTATQTASDDFIALDGTVNGTRKIDASAPSFKTSVTSPSIVAPAATNLTLAGGSTGASLVLGQGASGAKIVGQSPSSPMTVNIGQTGTAGTSIEMVTSAGLGYIQHFNRTSVAYVPLEIAGEYVQTRTAAGVSTRLTSTGNLLIGTTTDGGQKLQVNGTAAFADAITVTTSAGLAASFTNATDNNWSAKIIKSGGNELQLSGNITANSGPSIRAVTSGGAAYAPLTVDGSTFTAKISSVAALTIASTGAATFAGAMTFSSTATAGFGGSVQAGPNAVFQTQSGIAVFRSLAEAYLDSGSAANIYLRPGLTTALTLAPTTLAATFAGAVTGSRFIASTSLIAGDFTSTNDLGIVAKTTTATYNPLIAAFLAPNQLAFGVGGYSNVYCGVAQSAYNSGALMFSYAGAGSTSNSFGLGIYGQSPAIRIDGTGVVNIPSNTPSTGAGSGALQVAGGIYSGAASVFGGNVTIPSSILYINNVYNYTGGATPLKLGWTGSAAVLSLFSSGAATFAGAVAIGNTVATAAGVASTHKVTMVIGGVTYYLLASNV